MNKFGFITNKYTVSVLILLGLLGADIILHRGMSRVIIPADFSDKISPVNLPLCSNPLLTTDKHWVKAVNNIDLMKKLPGKTAGIEIDVYFDLLKNQFKVFHDSSAISSLNADSLLASYDQQKLKANIWFDFKNLDASNESLGLKEVLRLQAKYGLQNKFIIESSSPKYLGSFCDSGFFTSYYVPYFNPYQASENAIIQFTDSIKNNLGKYPTSALSGYYYQYPILKKFFPNYPLLTWADNATLSVVSFVFKRQLDHDSSIKVILLPFQN